MSLLSTSFNVNAFWTVFNALTGLKPPLKMERTKSTTSAAVSATANPIASLTPFLKFTASF